MPDELPAIFVTHASSVLADTAAGLTGSEIVGLTAAYAVEYGIDLPHPRYPFDAHSKRTALYDNLMAFSPRARYRVIRELCATPTVQQRNGEAANKLRMTLVAKYHNLDDGAAELEVSQGLVAGTRQWLEPFPSTLELYGQALQKYGLGAFQRNVLDDLRLGLEKLLQTLFGNTKSLENQIPALGSFIKERNGSPELANMFVKLVDYYAKYQNNYVKHDDAVIEEEVEFVLEITSSFMEHLVRMATREAG